MRVSFSLISLAILFSSTFVSAGPAPGDGGGSSCSTCWVEERNKIKQCQNLPKAEIEEFSQLSDQQIISKKDDFPHLIPCLCALVPKVPSIIEKCNCKEDDAKNLSKEGEIVKQICKDISSDDNKPTPKPNTSNANNTTPSNNKPGGGTGDDSTPGTGSGDGSGGDVSSASNSSSTNGSNPASTKNAAVSAQWTGSLIVTLGAVVVAVVAL